MTRICLYRGNGGIQMTYGTPLDSPSFRERGGSLIFFVVFVVMVTPRIRIVGLVGILTRNQFGSGKDKLGSKVGEGNTGFVFLRKDVGNVAVSRNVSNAGVIEADAVADPEFTNIHMAETFGEGNPPAPIHGTLIVVIQWGSIRYIGQPQIEHDVPHHFDGFGALVQGVNFGFARAARATGFPLTPPCHGSAASNNKVAQKGPNGVFGDGNNTILWWM